jgi:hypothetical protein
MLLHAVVQNALDRTIFGVAGKNEPRPGRAQLGDLRAKALDVVVWFGLLGLQGYRPPGRGSLRLSVAAPQDVK